MVIWDKKEHKVKIMNHQECTATLIASNWALTAAHCDEPDPVTKRYQPLRNIVLGVHDISKLRSKDEDIPGTHRFVKYHVHPFNFFVGKLNLNLNWNVNKVQKTEH